MLKLRESISMILENIMVKLKIVLSLVCRLSQVSRFFSMPSWRTALSFIVSQLQRLYNAASNQKMFLGVDLMSYSYGIVLVIILLCILGIS